MKKSITIVLIIILSLVCINLIWSKSKDKSINNNKKTTIEDSLNDFYLNQDPNNQGSLKIYATKKFNDNILVLSDKPYGEGELYSELFLLDKNLKVLKYSTGHMPISQCFSVNQITYENCSIIFGNFNNTKLDEALDKQVPVDIHNLKVLLNDGTNSTESVSSQQGYILVLNSTSEIKDVTLSNKNDQIQSSLKELHLSNNLIKTTFYK